MDPILTSAQLVRVDVYDAGSSHCDGAQLAPGAGPALSSKSFAQGQAIKLSLAPGKRTVVVTTFGDSAGTTITGSACQEIDLSSGKSSCLAIEVTEVDAGSSGCTMNSDCAPQLCDTMRHTCVDCLSAGDCPSGKVCSPSGRCTDGCDATHPCSGGQSCCDGFCVDTRSDPLHCNGCGMACSGGDTLCCNGQCANPQTSPEHCGGCGNACSTLHGTPVCASGSCSWSCDTGFAHCGSGNSGCDTDVTTVDNCGGCGNLCMPTNASANRCMSGVCAYTCQSGFLDCQKVGADTDGCESGVHAIGSCGACGVACDTTHSMGASCPATTCVYTGCAAGYSDCDMTNGNANGCESMDLTHSAGVMVSSMPVTYVLPCSKAGTPGNAATYTQAMAQAACGAWTAASGGGSCAEVSCTGNVSCQQATTGGTCVTWCYTKSLAGHVASAATCMCPNTGSPSWN